MADAVDDIFEWRVRRFEELGFDVEQAMDLALAKGDNGWLLDTHYVAKILAAGCTHDLALRILSE